MQNLTLLRHSSGIFFTTIFILFLLLGFVNFGIQADSPIQQRFQDLPQDRRSWGFISEVVCLEDLNKDGNLELMFSGYQGGNCWICSGYIILTFEKTTGEVKDITPRPFQKVWMPMDTKDLNKDGIPELLILDGRLEMIDGLSHAGSPYSKIVYGWSKEKGNYVNDQRFFGDFYERKIKESLKVVKKPYSEEYKYEFIKSWFELFLHLKHSSSSPWKEFKSYWDKYSEKDFPYSLENIRIGMERSGIIISDPEDKNEES